MQKLEKRRPVKKPDLARFTRDREILRTEKTPCERRKIRRAVLLSEGKVNKPGGAPGKNGHYRKRGVKCP